VTRGGRATGNSLVGAALALALAGCRAPEPREAVEARNRKVVLENQLIELGKLVEKARRGELVTEGQIAIGVSESLVQRLLTASLPPDRLIGKRLHIALDQVEPLFRGGLALIRLRARVSAADLPNAKFDLDIVSGLKNVRLEKGRLLARVSILHFRVVESFAGDVGKNLIEDAVRANLEQVENLIPALEIPVLLEESVDFGGIKEGPVRVGPGRLPLELGLSHVLPVNERLWLLVRAEAGTWQSASAKEEAP
jgi:hypothetical protein